ncbi:phosphonate metabolism transcriptional regulator PhnF [Pinisolibacter sp.]|uniref:phosphonate metabolism transcriptional regulator PhnF n=1 Tax=Pinisolibacter sp. TaxID=2172024 RepID=UPI002FDCE511
MIDHLPTPRSQPSERETTGSPAQRGRMPMWHSIRMELEHEIRSGLIGPGSRLPSEHDLAQRWSVNRHTVRAAFASLAAHGLVVARRGAGVFVAERPAEYPITRDSKWSEIEERFAAAASGHLVASHRRTAQGRVAELLGLEPGHDLIVVESVRSATPRIVGYGYHSFDAARFAGIDETFARTRSFTTAIAAHGVPRFFRTSTWIDCRMPRDVEATALDIGNDTPVMIMSYVDADPDGRPILFGIAVLPPGSLTLRIDT